MNKTQAKFVIYQELSRQIGSNFSFMCLKDGNITAPSVKADMWNLSFPIGAPLGEIQVTLAFHKEWIDVLAFPHPRIIDEGCVLEMIRFINSLNAYVKLQDTNGRFYVDEDALDVVYSARLSYKYMELMLLEAVRYGVLGLLDFVADAAIPLNLIGQGAMTVEEGYQYMVELWENQ